MGSGKGKSRRASARAAAAPPRPRTAAELLKKYPYEETKLYELAAVMGGAPNWLQTLPILSPFLYATGLKTAPDSINAEYPGNVLENVLGQSCQIDKELAGRITASPKAFEAADELAGRYQRKFDDAFELSDKDYMISVRANPGGSVVLLYADLVKSFYSELVKVFAQSTKPEKKPRKKLEQEFKKVSF